MDLEAVAKIYIFKSLVKTKSIVSAPGFPKHILKAVEKHKAGQNAAYANVSARLFNSRPVKDAMVEVMNTARRALGVQQPKKEVEGKKVKVIDTTSKKKDGDISVQITPASSSTSSQTEIGWDGFKDSERHSKSPSTESIEEESDTFGRYNSRLASDSSVSGSDEEVEMDRTNRHRKSSYSPISTKTSSGRDNPAKRSQRSVSPSPSPSPTPSPTPSASSRSSSPGPFRHPVPVPLSAKSTTFLPSLSLVGYYSGNSSESEGGGVRGGRDGQPPQVRKNRMGQQARRALWEKKYGALAKHVQQPKKAKDRDQGWDPRKGAVEGGARGRTKGFEGARGGAGRGRPRAGATGANTDPLGRSRDPRVSGGKTASKDAVDEKGKGVNHPSWEAARKAKESKKNTAPAGKKIVFD